ncbi:ferredoxin family protein [Natranaeroarchaeum sulfidigenes]|uniref:Ferredoxin-like protein n=1 Tax=Natranaeroarchaeum sulfidigenes TaxID=2784880 RepID=A0A897MU19_9EURY|nr:4Fe-4S dicluster domain-containing protein [Natranaeroarchaeum sulfidigenes]QSG04014.1 Ferredoxin-like protein [Natranaeroarchaeum sulfidigenes]
MSTKQNSVDNASLEDRLYTVKYEDPGESHLDVKVPGICEERCRTDDCVDVCPADVWREGEDGVPHIAYENCLECSSCRFACPHNNVVWTYPENGSGVTYSYG